VLPLLLYCEVVTWHKYKIFPEGDDWLTGLTHGKHKNRPVQPKLGQLNQRRECVMCCCVGVNLLIGTDGGMMLLDRSGQGKGLTVSVAVLCVSSYMHRTHVNAVVRSCFATLRQIRSVRLSLPCHALLTLVRALVVSKVDYCNSVLAGVSRQLQDRLQSVLNAAARSVFSARRSGLRTHNSNTPSLQEQELHWLKVPEWIRFRL